MNSKDNPSLKIRTTPAGLNDGGGGCLGMGFGLGLVFRRHGHKGENCRAVQEEEKDNVIWMEIRAEAMRDSEGEMVLASHVYSIVLEYRSLEHSLALHLGNKLSSATLSSDQLYNLFLDALEGDRHVREAIRADVRAMRDHNPVSLSFSQCMLDFKGFQACQAYRLAHALWNRGRTSLALAIQSRIFKIFNVNIHPSAKIGKGILFDHAIGVVVGEMTTIGDNVTILHHVTIKGGDKKVGDGNSKVGNFVLIGVGATIIGNITIGDGAKIGAGAVVLFDVPPSTTAVGNPARLIGGKKNSKDHKDIPIEAMDHTASSKEWSDYVI